MFVNQDPQPSNPSPPAATANSIASRLLREPHLGNRPANNLSPLFLEHVLPHCPPPSFTLLCVSIYEQTVRI